MEHPDALPPGIDADRAPLPVDLATLAVALEASWDHRTAYQGVTQAGNPAFGQCYPTSRVVQFFYPEFEIACGEVWTGSGTECHFWNVRGDGEDAEWIDLSWQQFPPGSAVTRFRLLDRRMLGDSPSTVERCALLLRRVLAHPAVAPWCCPAAAATDVASLTQPLGGGAADSHASAPSQQPSG